MYYASMTKRIGLKRSIRTQNCSKNIFILIYVTVGFVYMTMYCIVYDVVAFQRLHFDLLI